MAGRILELKGSGDQKTGAGGVNATGVAVVLDAADQDEATALAEAFFPALIGSIPRGSIDVKDQGNDVYLVTVDYQSAIRSTPTDPTTGETPTGARPSPSGGSHSNDDPLSRDVTFTMGTATKHIYQNPTVSDPALGTRYKIAKAGDTAPDFGGLIGVDPTKGTIAGVEILAPTSEFTISKRFAQLTLGWFRNCLDFVATTNSEEFYNCEQGEVLFKGADGHYKDGDANPWSVTAKFGYSRNRNIVDDPVDCTFGELTVPDIRGWDYVWLTSKHVDETVTVDGVAIKVMIDYPRWLYVESVYHEKDHNTLGFN